MLEFAGFLHIYRPHHRRIPPSFYVLCRTEVRIRALNDNTYYFKCDCNDNFKKIESNEYIPTRTSDRHEIEYRPFISGVIPVVNYEPFLFEVITYINNGENFAFSKLVVNYIKFL